MIKKKFKQSNCVDFVNLLNEVRIRGHNINCKNGNDYVTTYNGFSKVNCFITHLKKKMQLCQNELQHLPLNQPTRDGRMDYIVILYKNLHKAKLKVENPKIQESLERRFYYVYYGDEPKLKRFPCNYSKEKYPTDKDYQNHKVHFMYNYHKKTIDYAIEQIKFLSNNKELLNSVIIPPYVSQEQNSIRESEAHPIQRFKTSLTVNQLAYFFDLISDIVISDSISKREVAQLLSQTFETPKTKQPSVQQIYKAFYNVDNSTKETIKDIVLKMLRKVK